MSLNFKTKTTQKFKNRPDIGEELVKKFFKGKNGFFVDVGANHPIIDSQSYHLECIGWDGILVEPLKTYTNMLLKERSAKLIEVACSSRENHNKVLEIIDAGVHSTLNKEPIAVGVSSNKTQKVKCKTLDSVLEDNNVKVNFEFLSIDIEGHEMELFDGFTIGYWLPQLIILEDHVINRDKHNYMRKNNYSLICRTGLNSWYVPKTKKWKLSLTARIEFFRKYYLAIKLRKIRYSK